MRERYIPTHDDALALANMLVNRVEPALRALAGARERAEAAEARVRELEARIETAADVAVSLIYSPWGSLWNHGTRPTRLEEAQWEGCREAARDILALLDPDRARAALGEGGGEGA